MKKNFSIPMYESISARNTQIDVHELSRAQGWWDSCAKDKKRLKKERLKDNASSKWVPDLDKKKVFKQIPEKLMLIVSEVAEMMEEFRIMKFEDITKVRFEKGSQKPEGFASEAADVAIRLFELCEALGINLSAAIALKHNYNRTRPFRHGGKRA